MNIEFLIITKSNKLSETILPYFLKKENNGILSFNKYDYKEPLKKQLDVNNLEEPKRLFEYYGNLIFKGKNKSSMSINSYKEGFAFWMGSITANKNISQVTRELISLIESISANNCFIYGKLCSEKEYDLKHKVTTEWSYSWKGVSRFDFMKFLPGIYWYTIFGRELVDSIGKEKFKDLPNVVYTTTEKGCVSFHINEPIENEELEHRVQLEREIANMIGDKYFFDKTKDINTLGHHPKFIDFLKSLSK